MRRPVLATKSTLPLDYWQCKAVLKIFKGSTRDDTGRSMLVYQVHKDRKVPNVLEIFPRFTQQAVSCYDQSSLLLLMVISTAVNGQKVSDKQSVSNVFNKLVC